jgi:hypothetical protein
MLPLWLIAPLGAVSLILAVGGTKYVADDRYGEHAPAVREVFSVLSDLDHEGLDFLNDLGHQPLPDITHLNDPDRRAYQRAMNDVRSLIDAERIRKSLGRPVGYLLQATDREMRGVAHVLASVILGNNPPQWVAGAPDDIH